MSRSLTLWNALLVEVNGSIDRAFALYECIHNLTERAASRESARAKRLARLCRIAEMREERREWLELQRHRESMTAEEREDEERLDEQERDYNRGLGL